MNIGFGPTMSTRRSSARWVKRRYDARCNPTAVLPVPGTALDDERRLGRSRDEAVLVGLDRGDDVAHARVARAFELLQQEVVERSRNVGERAVERFVADARERSALEAEAASEGDAVRLGGRRGVEGTRGWRLPVDDEHAVVVVDPPAPDVEGVVGRVQVEPPEAKAVLRILVGLEPPDRPCLDRLGRHVCRSGARGAEHRPTHLVEALVRVVDVGLLGSEIRVRHESSPRDPAPRR